MRQRFARLTAAAVLMLATAACGSGDGPDFIWLRSMHAIPDAPQLRVHFDGYVFRRNINFGSTTDEGAETLLRSADVSTRYHLDYFGPNGQIAGEVLSAEVPIQQDAITTVVFAGWFEEPEAIVVVTPRPPRPLAALQFQFVHATPDVGALDVYVTEADTELTATAPIATIQTRGHSEPVEVPFGSLRIRLAPAGTLDVILDTGPRDFGALETATGPGAQWLFAVAPTVAPGPSPVFLISSSGGNNVQIRDQGHTAVLRAMHALRDGPDADVVAVREIETDDEDETETEETVLYTDLAFGQRSPRVPVPSGTLTLEYRATTAEEDEEEAIASRQVAVQVANEYGVYLVDGATVPSLLFAQVNSRSVATEGRLLFGNLAPESGFITVYVTDNPDDELTSERFLVRDMAFSNISNHIGFPPGDYFLTLTARETQTSDADEPVIMGPLPFEVAAGDVRSHLLLPPEVEGDPLLLEVFDDRAP